jgi:hypothetical protein
MVLAGLPELAELRARRRADRGGPGGSKIRGRNVRRLAQRVAFNSEALDAIFSSDVFCHRSVDESRAVGEIT